MIQLIRSLYQPLLHPCENMHFLSKEAAEEHVQMLKEDPNNKYFKCSVLPMGAFRNF
jgi:hypothetical protein